MSTPFARSLISGNFDFPPANMDPLSPPSAEASLDTVDPRVTSRHHSGSDTSTLPELHRHLQNLEDMSRLNRERLVDARQRLYLSTAGTRRQIHEDQAAAQHFPTSDIRPRVLGGRLRRRLAAGQTIQQRHPVRFGSTSFGLDISDPPLPRMDSLDMASAEYYGEAEVNRRRKRPKLNHDSSNSESQKFHYDWKGRTVPGRLKMQIHECDGGVHTDTANPDPNRYKLENVLVNDQSVYCTKRPRCNIVLKHLGEACFSLTKIVIKAPGRGFTAPIQEGLIFAGMSADDLMLRTSQYQFSHPGPDDDSDNESTATSLILDERPRSRRRDSSPRVVPPAISDGLPRILDLPPSTRPGSATLRSSFSGANNSRSRLDDSLLSAASNSHDVGEFTVKSHCNEPSDDEEEASSPSTLADRHEREQMPTSYTQASDDEEDQVWASDGRLYRYPASASSPHYRGKVYKSQSPSTLEITRADREDEHNMDVLPPLAKFFIEKDKNVVSISFDPPVSGKFVLIKLYSTIENQNIDVQSIGVYGFAGARTMAASQTL